MGCVCLSGFVTGFFGRVNMKNWYCRLTSQGALCHTVFPAGANTPGVWGAFRAGCSRRSPEHTPARTGSVRFSGAGRSLPEGSPAAFRLCAPRWPREGSPGRTPPAGRGKRLQAGRRTDRGGRGARSRGAGEAVRGSAERVKGRWRGRLAVGSEHVQIETASILRASVTGTLHLPPAAGHPWTPVRTRAAAGRGGRAAAPGAARGRCPHGHPAGGARGPRRPPRSPAARGMRCPGRRAGMAPGAVGFAFWRREGRAAPGGCRPERDKGGRAAERQLPRRRRAPRGQRAACVALSRGAARPPQVRPRRPPAAPRDGSAVGIEGVLLGAPDPGCEVFGALGEQGGRVVEIGGACHWIVLFPHRKERNISKHLIVLISVKLYSRQGEIALNEPSVCRAELGGGGWLWSVQWLFCNLVNYSCV